MYTISSCTRKTLDADNYAVSNTFSNQRCCKQYLQSVWLHPILVCNELWIILIKLVAATGPKKRDSSVLLPWEKGTSPPFLACPSAQGKQGRVSKSHRLTVVQQRQLTLHNILRFVCANWKIHDFLHFSILFLSIFTYFV